MAAAIPGEGTIRRQGWIFFLHFLSLIHLIIFDLSLKINCCLKFQIPFDLHLTVKPVNCRRATCIRENKLGNKSRRSDYPAFHLICRINVRGVWAYCATGKQSFPPRGRCLERANDSAQGGNSHLMSFAAATKTFALSPFLYRVSGKMSYCLKMCLNFMAWYRGVDDHLPWLKIHDFNSNHLGS